LREKQKARAVYGILERQFRRHLAQAARMPGVTGENLLQLLERRLDNTVYRLGLGESRSQARQLVLHGHFLLNGRKVRTPSILVNVGDEVAVSESSKKLEIFKALAKSLKGKTPPGWLSLDEERLSAKVLALPSRGDVDARISEQAIIEYYAR
jgi:small subunit ribosomal protein S4